MKTKIIWIAGIGMVVLAVATMFIPTPWGMTGAWDNGSWSVLGTTRLCLYSDGTFHAQNGGSEHEGVWEVGWFRLTLEFCRQREVSATSAIRPCVWPSKQKI